MGWDRGGVTGGGGSEQFLATHFSPIDAAQGGGGRVDSTFDFRGQGGDGGRGVGPPVRPRHMS